MPGTMKKAFLITLFTATVFTGFAQYDTIAPVLRSRHLPSFSLLSVDSVAFNQSVLDTGKHTILMLFNPDCEHCKKQLQRFLSMPEFYISSQLVMISIETVAKTKHFYNRYHLKDYPFIHIGKDYKRFFISYFRAETIPVLAFYNTRNELALFKQGDVEENDIREAIK